MLRFIFIVLLFFSLFSFSSAYEIVCFDHILNSSVNMTVENITQNISANISITVTNTTNISVMNETNTTVLPCLYNFSIQVDDIFLAGESIPYTPFIENEPDDFIIEYWWEDYYNNSVKAKRNTTNTNEKRYTPTLDNVAEKLFYIKMNLYVCNQTFFTQKLVVVTGGEVVEEETTTQTPSSSTTGGATTTTQEDKEVLQMYAPTEVFANESIEVLATIYNEGYSAEVFLVWAYVYYYSVNLTPREDIYEVLVQARSEEIVTLELPGVQQIGNFSLKTKVLKPGRATPYEVRQDIVILEQEIVNTSLETVVTGENTSVQINSDENETVLIANQTENTNSITGFAVFEQTLPDKILKSGAWIGVLLALGLWGIQRVLNFRQNAVSAQKNR